MTVYDSWLFTVHNAGAISNKLLSFSSSSLKNRLARNHVASYVIATSRVHPHASQQKNNWLARDKSHDSCLNKHCWVAPTWLLKSFKQTIGHSASRSVNHSKTPNSELFIQDYITHLGSLGPQGGRREYSTQLREAVSHTKSSTRYHFLRNSTLTIQQPLKWRSQTERSRWSVRTCPLRLHGQINNNS